MTEVQLKAILAAMIADIFKKECDKLMPILDKIICDVVGMLEKHGIPFEFDEVISSLCNVLPLIHEEYCDD